MSLTCTHSNMTVSWSGRAARGQLGSSLFAFGLLAVMGPVSLVASVALGLFNGVWLAFGVALTGVWVAAGRALMEHLRMRLLPLEVLVDHARSTVRVRPFGTTDALVGSARDIRAVRLVRRALGSMASLWSAATPHQLELLIGGKTVVVATSQALEVADLKRLGQALAAVAIVRVESE